MDFKAWGRKTGERYVLFLFQDLMGSSCESGWGEIDSEKCLQVPNLFL